jgi:hypothetical protein
VKPSASSGPFSYAGAVRRAGASAHLVLLALLATGYRWEYLPFLRPSARLALPPGESSGVDRRPLHERRDPLPPALVALFAEASRRVAPGESIRFLPPPAEVGLSYAYYRAGHALAGCRLLPPDSTASATWIAAWRRSDTPADYEEIWTAGDSARLLRRRK